MPIEWTDGDAAAARAYWLSETGKKQLERLKLQKTRAEGINLEQVGMAALIARGEDNVISLINADINFVGQVEDPDGYINFNDPKI